jgi:hypothetical protein
MSRSRLRKPAQAVAKWLGITIAAAIVGFFAIRGLVLPAISEIGGGSPSPIPEQLAAVQREAASQGLFAVYNRDVELKGNGEVSHLFVFRPREGTKDPIAGDSDQIRIYDERDGELEQSFRFQPKVDRVPYHFKLSGIGRYDETDREEAVGTFDHTFVDATHPYPVALVWDERQQEYAVRSLLTQPLDLRRSRGERAKDIRADYNEAKLTDVGTGSTVAVHGTDFFSVRRHPFPIFAAAFTVGATCNACQHTYEIRAWRINFQRPVPATTPCGPKPVLQNDGEFHAQFAPTLVQRYRSFDPVSAWLRQNGRVCYPAST